MDYSPTLSFSSTVDILDMNIYQTNSEVHKARRKGSGELLALKRILMHNENEGIPITALREIKILKRLRHENIVPLHDIAISHGKPGMLMRTHA